MKEKSGTGDHRVLLVRLRSGQALYSERKSKKHALRKEWAPPASSGTEDAGSRSTRPKPQRLDTQVSRGKGKRKAWDTSSLIHEFKYNPRVAKLDINRRIREAAEEGDAFAQFEMGLDFDLGRGAQQSTDNASEYYLKAANQGHQSAKNNLLLQHVLGYSSVLEPEMVFAQLGDTAATGDCDAENNFGLCFQRGYGTAQDYREAAIWFRRAAEAGLATAQFNLGGAYFEGNGLEKDLAAAIKWYTRAAEQGNQLALLQLGNIYQKGLGVVANVRRAFVLYLIAYKQGSARAANHLAFMFRTGLGVKQEPSLAFELYLQSINEPDTTEIAPNLSYPGSAYHALGKMTENGEGTKRDLQAAKRWYRRGAACGASSCKDALTRLKSEVPSKRRPSKKIH